MWWYLAPISAYDIRGDMPSSRHGEKQGGLRGWGVFYYKLWVQGGGLVVTWV